MTKKKREKKKTTKIYNYNLQVTHTNQIKYKNGYIQSFKNDWCVGVKVIDKVYNFY